MERIIAAKSKLWQFANIAAQANNISEERFVELQQELGAYLLIRFSRGSIKKMEAKLRPFNATSFAKVVEILMNLDFMKLKAVMKKFKLNLSQVAILDSIVEFYSEQ